MRERQKKNEHKKLFLPVLLTLVLLAMAGCNSAVGNSTPQPTGCPADTFRNGPELTFLEPRFVDSPQNQWGCDLKGRVAFRIHQFNVLAVNKFGIAREIINRRTAEINRIVLTDQPESTVNKGQMTLSQQFAELDTAHEMSHQVNGLPTITSANGATHTFVEFAEGQATRQAEEVRGPVAQTGRRCADGEVIHYNDLASGYMQLQNKYPSIDRDSAEIADITPVWNIDSLVIKIAAESGVDQKAVKADFISRFPGTCAP